MTEEEKIHSKKYKLFFKTVLYGSMPEEELNQMWDRLEGSLNNPYSFDLLLEEAKTRREKEIE